MKLLKVSDKTSEQFKENLAKPKPMLILFFADWCPHCQMFEPTWKRITDKLTSKRGIQVAQVEYSDLKYVPKKNTKISGFPTIQVLKEGKLIHEYNGNRTEEDILAFVEKLI